MNGDKIPPYSKAKGSTGVSGIGSGIDSAPKTKKSAGQAVSSPAGLMDSRPSNADRTQSAK